MNREQLLKNIYKNFNDIPYPMHDYYNAIANMEYMDLNEIKTSINQKKTWQDVSIQDMITYHDFIYFLNDIDKIYYFPTYMKYIITNNELLGHGLDITFFIILDKIDLSLLNKKQLQVILDFLVFCKKNNNEYEYEYDEELLEKAYKRIINMEV